MSYIFKMTYVNNLEKKKKVIAYEAAAAHNIIVLFPNFSFLHHFFPHLGLYLSHTTSYHPRLIGWNDPVTVLTK